MTNTELIYLGITIVSALFGVIMFVRKPQEKSEITDAVFDEKFNALKEIVVNLRDNHIHTLDSKLDKHIADNQVYVEKDIAWKSRMEVIMENLTKK